MVTTHKADEVRKVQKLFNMDIKSVDETNRQVTFCFSDNQPDRQGEVVDQSSWQTTDYMKNPIIAWGHDTSDNANILGQAVALDLNNNGKSFITAQFDDADTNPKADTIFRQIVKRTLRAVSAGFINHTFEIEEDQVVLKDNELVEVSVVAVPANPRAIARSLKDGSLSTKDATWLRDSMRKEADELDLQLKEQLNDGDQNVEEVKAQLSALTEAMTKIAEAQTAQATAQAEALKAQDEKFDTLSTAVAALKPLETDTGDDKADKGDDNKSKDKKDADEGADDAKDDKKTGDDGKDADKKEDGKSDDESDAAKGGSDDQPGADADEFNEDAELTPEEQAQLDAELEEAFAA